MSGQTPSQTVGPYFGMILARPGENVLVPESTPGRIRIEGVVLDGRGDPIEDALIEIWQADAGGHYRHPDDPGGMEGALTGYGRATTDFETGRYRFETVKPGSVPDPEGELQAPHVSFIVQARGMLNPSFTRMYFPDEADANARDLVLGRVPEERRKTLIAFQEKGADAFVYRFDMRFQGPDETVFLSF